MENCARWSNYLLRVIAHAAVVANIVQSKGMKATRLPATENGADLQKSRSARRLAHNSSSSTSTEVARL